ncbi:hypothetical protein [Caulobacter sp. 1776]|uniref:hypothetical protein n=1 Tax=Caulobacter sp. 1776 TaxID=3156420 RepID=UPI00339AD4DF
MTQQSFQPGGRPGRIPTDPMAKTFENLDISLFDLYRASLWNGGDMALNGRTFIGCQIEGPAVMTVLPGVKFDGTDFGLTDGDIRNLVLRPAGPRKVIGTIPVQDCAFINCVFHGVGFTGPEAFLQQILSLEIAK